MSAVNDFRSNADVPDKPVFQAGATAGLVLLSVALVGMLPVGCVRPDPWQRWRDLDCPPVVFVSKADEPAGELYLLDSAGTIRRLTTNTRGEYNPALSPDRRRIAYAAGPADSMLGWELFVLDIASGVESRLTTNDVIDAHPDWSPDGGRLVFASWRDSLVRPAARADIWVMAADGSGARAFAPSPFEDNDPEWSPDGTRIAFKSTRLSQVDGREEIFTMNSDGTDVRRLTTTTGWQSDHDPSWDGNRILFNRFEGSRCWLESTNPDTMRVCWRQFIPWNIYAVGADGPAVPEQLVASHQGAGLPTAGPGGLLYLRLDFIIAGDELAGAWHRLVHVPDTGAAVQLLPDDRHTATLEAYDW